MVDTIPRVCYTWLGPYWVRCTSLGPPRGEMHWADGAFPRDTLPQPRGNILVPPRIDGNNQIIQLISLDDRSLLIHLTMSQPLPTQSEETRLA